MALTDDELLDFDHRALADFDLEAARRALAEHRDAYRAQLVTARWIDGWRERIERRRGEPTGDSEDWHDGFDFAARELAAHLRQGDFLPGGVLYEDDAGRTTSG